MVSPVQVSNTSISLRRWCIKSKIFITPGSDKSFSFQQRERITPSKNVHNLIVACFERSTIYHAKSTHRVRDLTIYDFNTTFAFDLGHARKLFEDFHFSNMVSFPFWLKETNQISLRETGATMIQ